MKKLILVALFLIAGIFTKAQIWQADTLRYFKNYSDTSTRNKPDTMSAEEIFITIENGKVNITKINAEFNAKITDTLPMDIISREVYIRNYAIRTVSTVNGKIYEMEMHMMYFRNTLISFGLSRNSQIFLYSIVGELTNL